MSASPSRTLAWMLSAVLVAAVAAVYWQTTSFEFVRYDDPEYVLTNPVVRDGLSAHGLRWALTAAHSSNWHPLTWLSHMLDVELSGLDAGRHHLTSVLLHALASVLCFRALVALSGRTWAPFLVAALFALHPLRVESVAWVSERKDVLSGCAFFGLLWAHAWRARAPGPRRGALVFLLLLLGLASKPMLVTAPFVLLLLDAWPLRRLDGGENGARLGTLVREKLPLLALCAASVVATLWSQDAGGSLSSLEKLPLAARLANAPVAVLRYVGGFLAPHDLAYFYPHPALAGSGTGVLAVVLATAALAGLSALAVALRRRVPALFTGWSWFLGMLVPVVGIVQVGEQALADRYAYLPVVGLQLALVFPLCDLAAARGATAMRALSAVAALAVLGCGVLAARQARTWRDSEALFTRALAVNADCYPAWVGLGNVRGDAGDVAGAREAYEAALGVRPDYAPALYGLALVEQEHGDPERALALYRRAIDAWPGLVAAHLNLGGLLASRGQVVDAALCFERVLELEPGQADAHYNLGLLALIARRPDDARARLEAATASNPRHAGAWERLGDLALMEEDPGAARAAYERADPLQPRGPARAKLVWLLVRTGDRAEALRAVRLAEENVARGGGRNPLVLEAFAAALAATGAFERAVEVQQRAVGLYPAESRARAADRLERYRRGERVADGPP